MFHEAPDPSSPEGLVFLVALAIVAIGGTIAIFIVLARFLLKVLL